MSNNPLRTSVEDLFKKYDLDALWIKSLPVIKYLANFTGSTANLLITSDGKKHLNVDSRYTTQAKEECTVDSVKEITRPIDDLGEMAKEFGIKRLGFESTKASFSEHRTLSKIMNGNEMVPVDDNLMNLRIVKTEDELTKLRTANEIAQKAFAEMVNELHVGWTEKEAAWFLEKRFREYGGSGLSFDTLVCSGPRSAIVHGKPSDRAFKEGEFIIVDRGLFANHFASDETNTFVLGKADAKHKEIYQIVKDAHDRCVDGVKPGVKCSDLDALAREYIHDKGYGEYFGHGTGHGVGLEVHEMPVISPRGDGYLEEGMVFSIEPGIYIPEFGGVRIEDVVAVTADGCEVLTLADKTKFEIPLK